MIRVAFGGAGRAKGPPGKALLPFVKSTAAAKGTIAVATPTSNKPKINPLSRVPRGQRLVMAVRGGAGVGKSHFVRSMADAGLGRLCIFDVERKSRLLKGVGTLFDGIEIEHPDEL